MKEKNGNGAMSTNTSSEGDIRRTRSRGGFQTRPYEDIPGFCKSASLEEIREHGYMLTPGRYVGAAEIEDDGISFEEKMAELTATLYEQFACLCVARRQAEADQLDLACQSPGAGRSRHQKEFACLPKSRRRQGGFGLWGMR